MIKTYYNLNTQKFPSIFIRQFSSFEVRENSKVSHITRQYLEKEEKPEELTHTKYFFVVELNGTHTERIMDTLSKSMDYQ